MKTQYYTAASLDGFIATSDDSLEWLFPLGDVEATSYPSFIKNVGALADDRGLLDEMFVQVGSVTLGAGKPLLPRTIVSPPLRLISVKAVGTGFAELHYEVPRPSFTLAQSILPLLNWTSRFDLPNSYCRRVSTEKQC